MSTGTLPAVIALIVVVIALVVAAVSSVRRRRSRERFGPEHDRTVERADGRHAAERELRERRRRHDALDVRPLSDVARDRYTREWTAVQNEFVDRPEDGVRSADRLVTALMRDRGYPTEGFDQQVRDLSADHGRTLQRYRAAHQAEHLSTRHRATTEELRGAMAHYRALFDELLSDDGQARRAAS
ncbi:hypothetical protein ACICHK_03895 [Streptomyces sp. AHU1]|uniref:hypothetical protein n=1 Tax=Streptomyces sp. AHU1 TaxID=3377215 RepID=UPI0038783C1A